MNKINSTAVDQSQPLVPMKVIMIWKLTNASNVLKGATAARMANHVKFANLVTSWCF